MKKNKKDVYEEKKLTVAEEHYALVIELLDRKKDETIDAEDEAEIRGWIKALWEEMSVEERAIELSKADALREKYGEIL